jgi:hypothetical protein
VSCALPCIASGCSLVSKLRFDGAMPATRTPYRVQAARGEAEASELSLLVLRSGRQGGMADEC